MINPSQSKVDYRWIKIIEARMKSLIESTVDIKVTLKPGKEWAFDTANNVITYAIEGGLAIDKVTEQEIVGLILHEISHARYSTALSVNKLPTPEKTYASFLNAIEDIRIERKLMWDFPGTYDSFSRVVEKTQSFINEEHIALLPRHINFLMNIRSHEWGYEKRFKDAEIEKLFLDNKDVLEEAFTKNSSVELHEFLVAKLWDSFKKLLEEPPKKPEQPQSGEGEPDKNNKDESDKGEKEQQQGGGQGGGQGDPNNKEGDQGQKQEQNPGEGEQEDQNESAGNSSGNNTGNSSTGNNQSTGNSQNNSGVEESLKKAFENRIVEMKDIVNELIDKNPNKNTGEDRSFVEQLKKEIKEAKEAPLEDTYRGNFDYESDNLRRALNYRSYEELYNDVKQYLPFFKKKIVSIMEDNALKRHGGEYRSGKLNNKILYKWKCRSNRLFTKPVNRLHKEYFVTLVVDESGSMSGSNSINAARATVLLSEVLHAAKIPFEIQGFNGRHRIYKTFNDLFGKHVKKNIENITLFPNGPGSSSTNDAFAVALANQSIKECKGEKIMIVICDGGPNPSSSYISPEYRKRIKLKNMDKSYSSFSLKTEIHKAEQNGLVVGVGINCEDVREYYKHNVVCDTVGELPKLILSILRRNIHRG